MESCSSKVGMPLKWSPARAGARGCLHGRRMDAGVQGSGFRVQGSGFRVQGSGFRVQVPHPYVGTPIRCHTHKATFSEQRANCVSRSGCGKIRM